MENIVVAIDFSAITTTILETAAEVACCFRARVYLVHVAAPDPEFIGLDAGPPHERQSRADDLRHEKKQLEKFAARLVKVGVETVPLLIQGETAETLLCEVRRLDARLLVMGTHGHGTIISTLLGSTSRDVLQHAMTPVLLIPVKKP